MDQTFAFASETEFDFSSDFITQRHQSGITCYDATYSTVILLGTLRTRHYGLRTIRLHSLEDRAVRGVRALASGACEPAAAHPSVASREGGLEVLIVDGAIEVALVHQRVDDAPDLRVCHAVRRQRVGARRGTQ